MEAATAQQPEDLTEEAALAALTALILADLSAQALSDYAAALLAPAGIPAEAVAQVVGLLHPHLLPADPGGLVAQISRVDGAAERAMIRTTPVRHAAYLKRASERVHGGGFLEDERRFMAQHLGAEQARRKAGVQVDAAAQRWGPVLGWHAVRDSVTTDGCARAHGTNFHFDSPPLVEAQVVFPGVLHGGACRCRAGRPFKQGAVLPRA